MNKKNIESYKNVLSDNNNINETGNNNNNKIQKLLIRLTLPIPIIPPGLQKKVYTYLLK